jgi:hypothetical protein
MESSVICNITPYSGLKFNRGFRAAYRLHLQGRNVSQGELAACYIMFSLLGLLFEPEYIRHMFLRNVGWCSLDYVALYIAGYRTLHSHRCETLKPNNICT